jgi:branched-chain amino acid transport system ATP-binding protein
VSEPALRIDGLTTGYGKIVVVRDLSLHVAPGEVVALLGPNGAGKTTTLLAVSGLLPVLGGSIQALGAPVGRGAAYRVARRGVVHVPEDRSLFTQLTVAENLRMGAHGRDRAALAEVFGYFPALEPLQGRQAGLLSGGEQQMLAVARALLQKPKLLLVDEMSLGLAPIIVARLLPVLRQIADRTQAGVLFVEQHVHLALEVADRAYVMHRGTVEMSGTAAELRERRAIIESSYIGAPVLEASGSDAAD